jgi:acyl-CoA reductase-like NAD-dependent aldehyde dehydrogenase
MGETFQAINPANEEVLALARKATKVDLAEAVKVARKVYARWSVCKINPHLSTGQR